MGDAGDFYSLGSKPLREIIAGGIALHIRTERENDFIHIRQARLKFANPKILGIHAIERRDFSAQHMVSPLEGSGLINIDHVHSRFHYAQNRGITPVVCAEGARLHLGKGTTNITKFDAFTRVEKRLCQLLDLTRLTLHEMQRQTLS